MKIHEKMLNITKYKRNANQNYKTAKLQTSSLKCKSKPHTSQNGHHEKIYK